MLANLQMYDEELWKRLHATDDQLEHLAQIPGIQDDLAKFKRIVLAQTTNMGTKGIEFHDTRKEEFRLVKIAIEDVVAEAADMSAAEADRLHKTKDDIVEDAMIDGGTAAMLALEELHDMMDTQKDVFMDREVSLQFDTEQVCHCIITMPHAP